MRGVHRGVPELLRVHLTQAFVALNGIALAHALDRRRKRLIVVDIFAHLPLLDQIKRRGANIDMAV